jgi:hypothetical protein
MPCIGVVAGPTKEQLAVLHPIKRTITTKAFWNGTALISLTLAIGKRRVSVLAQGR